MLPCVILVPIEKTEESWILVERAGVLNLHLIFHPVCLPDFFQLIYDFYAVYLVYMCLCRHVHLWVY